MLLDLCCFFLRPDWVVCVGASAAQQLLVRHPQLKVRVRLFGSLFWLLTGGRQAGVRWREFRTCALVGSRNGAIVVRQNSSRP